MTSCSNHDDRGGDVLCLAVVRDSGREVDVFDARGRARHFSCGDVGACHECGEARTRDCRCRPGGGYSSVGRDEHRGDESGTAPAKAKPAAAWKRLCFSTHGFGFTGRSDDAAGAGVDGLLTPCFDENGEHGEPEEGCFCGVDTPHLHAHVHDPERCGGDGDDGPKGSGGHTGGRCDGGKGGKGTGGIGTDLGFLAQLTLHPIEYFRSDNHAGKGAPIPPGDVVRDNESLLRMSVNARFPKQCNSKELSRQLSKHGLQRTGRRLYKVQHDDHYDFLVHNDATDLLHLEHPCETCGDNDLHGIFRLVYKRSWRDADDERGFRLHFFEPAKQPFSVRHILADLFDLDSDRVRAVRCDDVLCDVCDVDNRRSFMAGAATIAPPSPLQKIGSFAKKHRPRLHSHDTTEGAFAPSDDDETLPLLLSDASKHCCVSKNCATTCEVQGSLPGLIKSASWTKVLPSDIAHLPIADKNVRSRFHVAKICCASEVPAIESVVQQLPGVAKVLVNTTTKTVYVDHRPSETTVEDIEAALKKIGFGAKLESDGAINAQGPAAGNGIVPGESSVGRSHLFVRGICCASEIPVIRSIVTPIEGVKSLTINVTAKIVNVDHDVDVVSAADVAKAMSDEGFEAQVKKDAGHHMAIMSGLPTNAFVSTVLSVADVCTEEQAASVGAILDKFPDGQIRERSVCISTKTLKVDHNPYFLSAAGIADAIEKGGFEATIVRDGAADGAWALGVTFDRVEEKMEHHVSRVSPFVAMSGVCWIISMLSYIGGNWEYLKYVGILSVVFGLPPIAVKSFRTLRRCQFDANCMMLFAALGAVALREFTEAAAVTFLFATSEALESRATARARNALSAIIHLRPDRANLINPITKETIVVPAASLSVGVIVSVRTGDKIPCDGVVIEGCSVVDESSLTGESRPIRKGPKDAVSGGTINTGATQLIVKTTATVDNSAVARLIRLVEEAQANRSPTEKIVDEYAKRYTPVVVLTSLCMCTIPWAWGNEVGREWTKIGLITMVVACPCALIISTPVTYVAGLAATAQKGVIVKGGAHLEALGRVKTIAFDKTGTLTEGRFALLHLSIIGEQRTRKEVLEHLALMEAPSSHPLAAALVEAARKEGISIPQNVTVMNHTIIKGEGVTATVDGLEVNVGNDRLFRRLGLYDTLPKQDRVIAESWAADAGTVGFISIEGAGIVGAYSVADAVRQESSSVVKKLKNLNITVRMLTGDGKKAALAIGHHIGLPPENIHSELLPEDKLELVAAMKKESSSQKSNAFWKCKNNSNVLMCGDGVNDAPALALADVGVAMGAGAALAMETSDVTLMDSDLNKLLYSISMGRRVLRTIVENVTFSLAAKAVVLGFTFAGKSSLWAAIASDVGAMLIVTLNGMKLIPSKKKVKQMGFLQRTNKGDLEANNDCAAITGEENNVFGQGKADTPLRKCHSECYADNYSCEVGKCESKGAGSNKSRKSCGSDGCCDEASSAILEGSCGEKASSCCKKGGDSPEDCRANPSTDDIVKRDCCKMSASENSCCTKSLNSTEGYRNSVSHDGGVKRGCCKTSFSESSCCTKGGDSTRGCRESDTHDGSAKSDCRKTSSSGGKCCTKGVKSTEGCRMSASHGGSVKRDCCKTSNSESSCCTKNLNSSESCHMSASRGASAKRDCCKRNSSEGKCCTNGDTSTQGCRKNSLHADGVKSDCCKTNSSESRHCTKGGALMGDCLDGVSHDDSAKRDCCKTNSSEGNCRTKKGGTSTGGCHGVSHGDDVKKSNCCKTGRPKGKCCTKSSNPTGGCHKSSPHDANVKHDCSEMCPSKCRASTKNCRITADANDGVCFDAESGGSGNDEFLNDLVRM